MDSYLLALIADIKPCSLLLNLTRRRILLSAFLLLLVVTSLLAPPPALHQATGHLHPPHHPQQPTNAASSLVDFRSTLARVYQRIKSRRSRRNLIQRSEELCCSSGKNVAALRRGKQGQRTD